jgi:LmbE family N-acetylglucosaminyl deacetylase
MSDAPKPLRLMAVLAHPDDETLGVGGALAHYAAQGVHTSLVTATHGQSGRYREHRRGDPAHPGREKLAAIRERELHAAAAILGIREVALLGYVDGELADADPAGATARIVGHLRRGRPQVVVTFAQDGGYGHPDHIAICQLTTAAVMAAADPGYRGGGGVAVDAPPHAVSKLYYMAWTPGAWAAYQEAFKTLVSKVDDEERQANPWPEWQLTTVLDTRAYWPTVWQAVQAHDSQVANYEKLGDLSPEHHEGLWGWQTFYRVFSTVNGGRRRETDLFEGLRS